MPNNLTNDVRVSTDTTMVASKNCNDGLQRRDSQRLVGEGRSKYGPNSKTRHDEHNTQQHQRVSVCVCSSECVCLLVACHVDQLTNVTKIV